MRIHLMSDLHMEHYRDAGKQSFYEHLREHSAKDFPEVVVLAGDIAIPNQIEDVLYAFSRLYSQSTILFVPGNHDYAGSSPTECHRIFRGVDLPNVRWLDNEVTEVQGVRFFGGTLWYDVPTGDAALIQSRFYDFRVIREFTPWVFE